MIEVLSQGLAALMTNREETIAADNEIQDMLAEELVAAHVKPRTFRQRMDDSVAHAEQLLEASRKMLAAAEAMLAAVQDVHGELK